jgi:hypothetical protein
MLGVRSLSHLLSQDQDETMLCPSVRANDDDARMTPSVNAKVRCEVRRTCPALKWTTFVSNTATPTHPFYLSSLSEDAYDQQMRPTGALINRFHFFIHEYVNVDARMPYTVQPLRDTMEKHDSANVARKLIKLACGSNQIISDAPQPSRKKMLARRLSLRDEPQAKKQKGK